MKKQIIAAVLFSSFSLPSFASGVYIFGDFERNKAEADAGNFSISKTENGYGLGLGYNINNTFTLEFAYRDLMSFSERENYEDVEYRQDTDVTALQLSVLANYPLNEKLKIYSRLGVGWLDIESDYSENVWGESDSESSSESETKAMFGIGTRYAFTETLAVRFEYSRFADIEETTLSSLSVGLSYNF